MKHIKKCNLKFQTCKKGEVGFRLHQNLEIQNQYVGHFWYLAKNIKMVTFYRNKDWIQFLVFYEIVVSKYLILYLIFYVGNIYIKF